MDGLPQARLTAIGMTSGELQKLERLYTLAQPLERAAMREFFASKVEQDLSEWLEVQREVGHFTVPPSAGPITEDEQAMLDLISAFIPMSQKGEAGGVGTLDETGRQPILQSPLSVVSSSGTTAGQTFLATGSVAPYSAPYTAHNTVFYDITAPPFNGVCDGNARALSSRFTSLGAAQAVYPFATALTQQIDACALQLAINTANEAGGGVVWVGGRPIIQQEIEHKSYVHVYGAGKPRSETQGLAVGSLISNHSNNTLVKPSFTAKTASSTTLEEISSFASLGPNIAISGAGIPIGTHVVSVNEGAKTAVLSQAATASAAGVTITPGGSMFNVSGCVNYGFHQLGFNYVGKPALASGEGNIAMAISDFAGKGEVLSGLATIEGCYFNNFGGTANVGLYGDVNWIFSNEFDQPIGDCIRIGSSTAIPGNNVGTDGFIAYNATGYTYGNGSEPGAVGDGIRMEGGAYLVLANDLYNCANGVNLIGSAGNRVIANRCEKHDFHGIAVSGFESRANIVSANLVYNCGYAAASQSGISLSNGAVSNTISGNYVLNKLGASGGEFTATTNGTTTLKAVKRSGSGAQFSNLRVGTLIYSHLNIPEGTYVAAVNEGTEEVTLSQAALTSTAGVTIFANPTGVGIGLSGKAERNNVTGNFVSNVNFAGINLNEANYNSLTSNVIETCGRQGILLEKSSDNQIDGAFIYNAGQFATNTYDGIVILIGANNMLHGAMIFGPATNKVRYGVSISGSETTNTSVGDCYCTSAFAAAAFNDTGKGTILTGAFKGFTVGREVVAVPASEEEVPSVAYKRFFYVANAAATLTLTIGTGEHALAISVPASAFATIELPGGQTMKTVYSAGKAPTWSVYGDAFD
jgi:parallel beta-helix repeat protein